MFGPWVFYAAVKKIYYVAKTESIVSDTNFSLGEQFPIIFTDKVKSEEKEISLPHKMRK